MLPLPSSSSIMLKQPTQQPPSRGVVRSSSRKPSRDVVVCKVILYLVMLLSGMALGAYVRSVVLIEKKIQHQIENDQQSKSSAPPSPEKQIRIGWNSSKNLNEDSRSKNNNSTVPVKNRRMADSNSHENLVRPLTSPSNAHV